jgi:pimeloyl-ACP methyl ester carboxylesterase
VGGGNREAAGADAAGGPGVIYPNASHMAHVEDTPGYVRLLDDFLSRVEGRL